MAVTSKCDKLLEVCCRHPGQSTPEKCLTNNDVDIFGKNDGTNDEDDLERDDDYDIFEKEDPTFDTDDVFKDDDYEDPIFGDPSGFGQCGKRNNEGVTATLREVNFLYGGKCKMIFRF